MIHVLKWHLATRGARIGSAIAPEADHSLPKRRPTDFLRTRGKSGARVDHKSVRLDAWLIVGARVLAKGFGALIKRLLT
jgi:hypothetical protein